MVTKDEMLYINGHAEGLKDLTEKETITFMHSLDLNQDGILSCDGIFSNKFCYSRFFIILLNFRVHQIPKRC